ncbi:hypothetical protein GS399_13725 [Pedobacter sp. HMF7647]|uniref:Uncharacterized protein n=1 Tax=Hufsiella arboris TaxID=2695275 RepID=A0A7K1YBU3_9SPHI|nr:hypothetical protein [Hufsiella arboris]
MFNATAQPRGPRPTRGSSGYHSNGGNYSSGGHYSELYQRRPVYSHYYAGNTRVYVRPSAGYYRPGYGYYRPGYSYYGYRPYYPYHYFGPAIGFRINVLPFGYYPFSYGGMPYYYSGGTFYRQNNDNYEVVTAPLGAIIPNLPSKAKQVTIDNQNYYEYNGTFYQPQSGSDGKTEYKIVGKDGVLNTESTTGNESIGDDYTNDNASGNTTDRVPQVGDIVSELPEGSKEVYIKNQKVYVSPSGVYYEDYKDNVGPGYKVVGVK